MLSSAVKCALPAATIALAVLLPFLGTAFRMDDLTFLLQAKHALIDPVHPTAFDMVFHGERLRLSRDMISGPIMAYLLVPVVLLGGAEWIAHSMMAGLLVIGAIGTSALALRLGLSGFQAAIAALLLVVSPAVLAMSATAMPDVPAMVFAVTGTERLLAWHQKRSWWVGAAASLLLAIAALSRPHLLLVFAFAALWLIDEDTWRSHPSRWPRALLNRSIGPLVCGVFLVAIVVHSTRDPTSGAAVADATLIRVDAGNIPFNFLSFASHWAVAFPLAVLWPILRGRRYLNFRRSGVALTVAAVLAAMTGYFGFYGLWAVLPVLAMALGLDVLADIAIDAWRRRDRNQVVMSCWLLIGCATGSYLHLPAKVLVPSAPAMAIVLATQVAPLRGSGRRVHLVLAAISAACVVVGVAIIQADAALAEAGRQGSRVAAQLVRQGEKVWIDGGWGFQWYSMQSGAEPLASSAPFPAAGDLVVAGLTAKLVDAHYPDKTLLYRRVFAKPGGRIHSEGAGFYENIAGTWPWVWGEKEYGRVDVWRLDSAPAAIR